MSDIPEENLVMKLDDSKPEEAAKNIDNANFFEVSPDSYVDLKPIMLRDVDSVNRVPAKLEQTTADFVSQSKQHRVLAKDDYHKLNFIEKRVKYYKERIIDIPEMNRENLELYNKKMDEGLTEEEEEFLQDTDLAIQEMSQKTYGIDGEGEQFFVDTLAGFGDIIRSYTENKGIIATGAIGGATLGGAVTLGVPVPGARVVGVGSGLATGLTAGFGAAGFWDGYKMMKGSVYKELSHATNEQGEPLNINESTKVGISYSVGVIGGMAEGLSGLVLAKGNPLLKRFISAKTAVKTLTKNPALLAKMNILGHMAKTALAEGGTEGLQEFIKIVGVNFGKMDESEASFINALSNSLNDETLKQVTGAIKLGASVGSLAAGVTSIPGYKGLKTRHTKAQQLAIKREQVLTKQNQMLEVVGAINSTKMKELSPGEMISYKKNLYSNIIGDEAWFTIEDLQDFGSTPEKQEILRQSIDPSGELNTLANELNTQVMLQEKEILEIAEQDPTFTDYMRLEPEGESPREIRNEAQEQVTRLEEAEAKRTEILANLGVDETLTSEQEAEINAILQPEQEVKDIESEVEFFEDIRFEPIEGIVTEQEIEILNTKELDARIEVAKTLKEDVEQEFKSSEDRIFKDVNKKDIQLEIQNLSKEHEIINRFKDSTIQNESTANHKKKGFSPLAIDPKSLPEDLKAIYLKDPKLKTRKTFVDGGIHVDEAAALAGVESAGDLLKLLSETPTRNELKASREQRKIELRNRIQQTIAPAKADARDKAFTNLTKNRLRQMKFLVSKEWSTLKRGIIKIAGRPPTVEGLNRKARNLILKTPVKDINPRRFEFGEKNSRKKAMKNWLNTEFEQTYKNLEAAALNNELRKESLNAKDKIIRFERFWKNVSKASVQESLRNAGMLEAMNEFVDVYKMSTSSKGTAELKSFNKFVKKQAEEGKFVPVIPERLADVRQSARDLTVEQYLTISEMGAFIVKQANLKNKLFKINQDRQELMTAEKTAQEIDEKTKSNPAYDPKKAERKSDRTLSIVESWGEKLNTALSAVASIKTIVTELDEFQLNGFFHNLIGLPIKQSFNKKRFEMSTIEKADRKIITEYGMKDFKKLFNTFVTIPELSDIPSFGDGEGNIRKIDLLTLQAYMGDPQGREAIPNFVNRNGEKLSIETVQLVLDRELSSKDAALVQSLMVDRFNRFRQRSLDLHKRTVGVEPKMVDGVGTNHNGVSRPGGYYPIRRQILPDETKALNFLDKIKNKFNSFSGVNENQFFAKLRTAEMTEQGRLKGRVRSDRPLDLNFDNVFQFTEEAVHDLHFREVGIDTLKILKNPINVKNIKSVIGPKKFTALLNHVKDTVSKTTEQETTLFAEEYNTINRAIDNVHSLHAVKAIGFNLTSMLVQPDSLKNLTLRVGPKTGLYLIKTAKKMSENLVMFEEYTKLAEEINPDIKFEKDNIDSAIIKESYDFIPNTQNFFKKYNSKSAQTISSIREAQKKAIDASFFMVREADKINKVMTTLAISEQFLNGDIQGFPLEKVNKMSDKEKASKLQSIVQQAIDLSLTASSPADRTALEKNKVVKLFLRYWTDRRSGLNSSIAQLQKVKAGIKAGEYKQAAKYLGTLSLVSGISAAWMNAIRDGAKETIKKIKVKDAEDAEELAKDVLWHFASSPVNQLAETIPVIDAVTYSADLDTRSDYRNVNVPFFAVANDVAMGYNALKEILEAGRKGKRPRLSDVHQKALLTNTGYLLGGLPTNSLFKLTESLQGRTAKRSVKHLKGTVEDLNKEINLFIKAFKDDPEAEKFITDLKQFQQQNLPLTGQNVDDIIPENSKDIIKEISSKGEWDAYNNVNGAAGIYQFTEERWDEIRLGNESLGLTEDGRVSKDTRQQEKAMTWSQQDNTRGLIALDVPVNNETLFGAHKFGVDNYSIIYNADEKEKLSSILPDTEKDNPVFNDFNTVKSVKDYVVRKLKEVDK